MTPSKIKLETLTLSFTNWAVQPLLFNSNIYGSNIELKIYIISWSATVEAYHHWLSIQNWEIRLLFLFIVLSLSLTAQLFWLLWAVMGKAEMTGIEPHSFVHWDDPDADICLPFYHKLITSVTACLLLVCHDPPYDVLAFSSACFLPVLCFLLELICPESCMRLPILFLSMFTFTYIMSLLSTLFMGVYHHLSLIRH